MTPTTQSDRTVLYVTLDDIIKRHGFSAVLRAMALRAFGRDRPVLPLGLNDHLRRDIGLVPPEDADPPWGLLW
jgi:hypothetical protein